MSHTKSKQILCWYVPIIFVSLFFTIFKIVQIVLSITDYEKINYSDCQSSISIATWLSTSGICGLVIFSYYLYKCVTMEKQTYELVVEHNQIVKFVDSVTLTYQLIWTILGCYIGYYQCRNTNTSTTQQTMYLVTIVDLLQLIFTIGVLYLQHRISNIRSTTYIALQNVVEEFEI